MSISPETTNAIIARIRWIETELKALRSTVDGEMLASSQRQYLARCFELLEMELTAVRTYLADLR